MCTPRAASFGAPQKAKACEKDVRNKKRTKFSSMFLPPPSQNAEKIWAPKIATKGHAGDQRTRRRPKDRTDTSLISNLSLSLSLFCVGIKIYSQFFFQEEKKTQNHPSEEGAENPPSFAFLSVFALSRWWCCFIRAREHAEESEHPPKRKKNKQTNKGRRNKKSQKSANVAFFSEQSAADF